MTTTQTDTIMKKLKLMTTSDNYLYELMLLYVMQYTYINDNRTAMVRGHPITEEWKTAFQNVITSNDFFLNTLFDQKEGIGTSDELVHIVKGNLCDIMNTTQIKVCNMMKGGILHSGIIGLNNFYTSSIQDTITMFDASGGTHDELVKILNAPDISAEDIIGFYFLDKAYQLINLMMRRLLQEDLDNFSSQFQVLILVYLALGVFVAIFVWVKICSSLEKEMACWMKMIRQIPWEIILSNQFLKKLLHIEYKG